MPPKNKKGVAVAALASPQPAREQQIVVLDGSNIAHDNLKHYDLSQLEEAASAVVSDVFPGAKLLVIVDASFRHHAREQSEGKAVSDGDLEAFQEKLKAHGHEFIEAPSGVDGKGDAFLLQVARKRRAPVVSNDSFQEFQAEHPWLFDDGRLWGGRFVGGAWDLIKRNPVVAKGKAKPLKTKTAPPLPDPPSAQISRLKDLESAMTAAPYETEQS